MSMKRLLLILILFTFPKLVLSQHNQIFNVNMLTSEPIDSFCDSTIGEINQIDTPLPSYSYLEDNGYCYYLTEPQTSFTLCFEFIAVTSGVYLNSGFTALGCTDVSFTQLTLCNKTQDYIVGQGQFFDNLIVGETYVWCITGTAIGQFCQGLTTICPYWNESSLLPVKLTLFTATPTNNGVLLHWVTVSESNSDYFILEKSKDLLTFVEVGRVKSAVYSTTRIDYEFFDKIPYEGVSYYRLIQVDLNGDIRIYDPIYTSVSLKKPVKVFDVFGNQVDMNYPGIKILLFEDGSAMKYY